MEDAFGHARQALYSRISGRSIYGLFTRPAVLALSDEIRAGIPIQALNQVCRRLIDTEIAADSDVPGTVECIAVESGFNNLDQFTTMFQTATGWHPYEWYRSYCRDTMPRRNRL